MEARSSSGRVRPGLRDVDVSDLRMDPKRGPVVIPVDALEESLRQFYCLRGRHMMLINDPEESAAGGPPTDPRMLGESEEPWLD
jgi:hypothetical protein